MIVHQLNGQLIEAVCDLLDIDEYGRREWIINAIVVRVNRGSDEAVLTLENSATLHYGERFYSTEECGPDRSVKWLDGKIPLTDSLAGHSVRTGGIVWVDSFNDQHRAEQYRDYIFVGIDTNRREDPSRRILPSSEYLFPIKSAVSFATVTLGVLNFEHYPFGSGCNPFQESRSMTRTEISDHISQLLSAHGSFLALALELDARKPIDSNQHLLECHQGVLQHTVENIRESLMKGEKCHVSEEHSSSF